MKIVVMEPLGISNEQMSDLISPFDDVEIYDTKTFDKTEQINRAKHADVLIIANTPLSGEVIQSCPNLKMISVAFAGVDHVDMNECRSRNILVSNAAGYCKHAVAELAIGLTLSVLRNIPRCDQRTRTNGVMSNLMGHELYGKTFGIVEIGRASCRERVCMFV